MILSIFTFAIIIVLLSATDLFADVLFVLTLTCTSFSWASYSLLCLGHRIFTSLCFFGMIFTSLSWASHIHFFVFLWHDIHFFVCSSGSIMATTSDFQYGRPSSIPS